MAFYYYEGIIFTCWSLEEFLAKSWKIRQFLDESEIIYITFNFTHDEKLGKSTYFESSFPNLVLWSSFVYGFIGIGANASCCTKTGFGAVCPMADKDHHLC